MSEAYAQDIGPEETYEGEQEEAPRGFDLMATIQSPNIAEELEDGLLAQIGAKVAEEFKLDETSRKSAGWDERYDAAMKLALQAKEAKSYPWPNAANVKYPLISTAAIQFNARAYPALIDGPEIVKGAVKGRPTPEKAERADRIGKHMSYQLLDEMDDWEEDTDRLLIQLPIVGCAFRKTWFDPLKGYNCSHLVSAGDFVVNYWTKDLETCPRATHILTFYPHDVSEKMRSGAWLDIELGSSSEASNDDDAPIEFLEQHRLWDLDEDGYPEPYIVTIHRESERVVRIVARFDETTVTQADDGTIVRIVPHRCFTKYGFIPSPDGSFYDIGFGTLLNPLSETINSTINQLMDAGHLSNVQGGFIGEGVSIKSGSLRFQPGEWKKASSTGASLRENIVPLPVKEPSTVLMSLLMFLVEAAKDVTATQDILGGDAGKGTMPVGTVSALIEQGLKTFTAIVKRLHRALKKELAILYRLNGRYLKPEDYFTFQDVEGVIAQADYAQGDIDVVPVSDPNMATDMQRMAQAQFVMQFIQAPGMNPTKIIGRALEAARVPNPEELFAPPAPPQPDPKLVAEQIKGQLKDRELDIKEGLASAQIANTMADAQQKQAELALMGPQLQQFAEAVALHTIQTLLGAQNGPAPPVHGAEFPGMAPAPQHEGFPPVPVGPEGGPGPAMGGGGGVEPPAPDQGPPPGGAFGPGVG